MLQKPLRNGGLHQLEKQQPVLPKEDKGVKWSSAEGGNSPEHADVTCQTKQTTEKHSQTFRLRVVERPVNR